jgi:hypothetical protein
MRIDPRPMTAGLYARNSWGSHGQLMGKPEAGGTQPAREVLISYPSIGADDGIRTRDPHLGKLAKGRS